MQIHQLARVVESVPTLEILLSHFVELHDVVLHSIADEYRPRRWVNKNNPEPKSLAPRELEVQAGTDVNLIHTVREDQQ